MKNINLNVISGKSVLSSIKIMNKYMNSFYKLTNVLLLLLLVFGSCGVSFGMEEKSIELINDENKNENKDNNKGRSSGMTSPAPKINYDFNKDEDNINTSFKPIDYNQHMYMLPYNIALLQSQGSRWGIRFGNGYGLMQYPNDLYNQDTNCLKCDTAYSKEYVLNSIYSTEERIQSFVKNSLFSDDSPCYKVTIREGGVKQNVRDMGRLSLNKTNNKALKAVLQMSIDEQLRFVYASICNSLYTTAARSNVMKLPILAEDNGEAVYKKGELSGALKYLLDEGPGKLSYMLDYNEDKEKAEMFSHLMKGFNGNILKLKKIESPVTEEDVRTNDMIKKINGMIDVSLSPGRSSVNETAGYLNGSSTFMSATRAAGGLAPMVGFEYCIKKVEDSLGMIRLYVPYLKAVDDIEKRKKQNESKQVNNNEDLARELRYSRVVLKSKLFQKYNDEILQSEDAQKDINEEKKRIKNEKIITRGNEIREIKNDDKESLQDQDDVELKEDKKSSLGISGINLELVKKKNIKSLELKEKKDKASQDGIGSKLIVEKKNKEIILNEQENNKVREFELGKYAVGKLDKMMENFFISEDDKLKDTFCVVGEKGKILTGEEECLALLRTTNDDDEFDDAVHRLIYVHRNRFIGSLSSLYSIMYAMGFAKGDVVKMEEVNPLAQLLYDNGVISGDLYSELECYARCRLNEFWNVFRNPDTSDYQKRNYGYRGLVYSSLGFVLSSVLSGIGAENNTWMELSFGGMPWDVYRSNIFTSFGINAQIPLPMSLPLIGSSLNIHVIGVNFLSLIISGVIFAFLPLRKIDDEVNTMINTYIDSLNFKTDTMMSPSSELPSDVIEPGLFRKYNKLSYIGKIMYYFGQSLTGDDEETKYLENNSFLFVLARRCLFDTLQYMSISIPVNTYLSINLNFGWFVVSWIMTGCKKLVLGWKNKSKSIEGGHKNVEESSHVDDDSSTEDNSRDYLYDQEIMHLHNKNKYDKQIIVKKVGDVMDEFEKTETKQEELYS